jgi:hypothetical protein
LPALGLEAEDLDRHIGASILTQATYADMVLTSARQLFGADVVARSIDDTRVFLDALSATARGLVERAAAPIAAGPDLRPQRGVEPRPRLQLVGGRPSAGRGGGPS